MNFKLETADGELSGNKEIFRIEWVEKHVDKRIVKGIIRKKLNGRERIKPWKDCMIGDFGKLQYK